MFLNLKNKKVVEVINQQTFKTSNYPKTHRDEHNQHQSKEQKQIKSFRQYQNYNSKKIVGSTAVSTIQPNNSSFSVSNNPNYALRKPQQVGRASIQSQSKSQEKLDSHRMQRVASAYKKIKKFDNNELSWAVDGEKSHERLKKLVNKGNKIIVKKELLHNIANNYICATQTDDNQSKIYEKLSSYKSDTLNQLIQPIIQVFANAISSPYSRTKSKSHSSREQQFNKSLDKQNKNQNKQKRKKSNQILIKDAQTNYNFEQEANLHSFIHHFNKRLQKGREKFLGLTRFKQYKKSLESSSIDLIETLFQEIQGFIFQIYAVCIKEMDNNLSNIEEKMELALKQETNSRQLFQQVQERLLLQQKKTKILQEMVLNYQQKSLYSTIFFNQLSFNSDFDSFFRQKLFRQAKRNGLVSDFSQSQVDQGKAEVKNSHTQMLKKKQKNEHFLQQNNSQNEFTSFKIPFFNKCLEDQAMKKRK